MHTDTKACTHSYPEMLNVFGCSVITGAEKAMCLQWQVHSGVSFVQTTRLQNNIPLSSCAYSYTGTPTHTHTRALLSNTQNQPNKTDTEVHTLTTFEIAFLLALLTSSYYPCYWHKGASLQGSKCVILVGLTPPIISRFRHGSTRLLWTGGSMMNRNLSCNVWMMLKSITDQKGIQEGYDSLESEEERDI